MKFIFNFLCLLISFFFISCSLFEPKPEYSDAPPLELPECEFLVSPFVEDLSSTNATFVWETKSLMFGWLEIDDGTAKNIYRTIEPGKVHRLTVDGLQPGKPYKYKAAGQTSAGAFRALNKDRDSVKFAFLGDNRTHPKDFKRIARVVSEHDIDLVIHSGDIVTWGVNPEEWYNEWFDPARKLLQRAPVLVAWGNHECPWKPDSMVNVYYKNKSQFFSKGFFSYQNGPATFVHINIYEDYSPGSEQHKWLESVLENCQSEFIIAVFHNAPFTSGGHATDHDMGKIRSYIVPLLYKYDVDLVINGHDHFYEKSKYGNTIYIISGGAGAPLRTSKKFLNPFSLVSTSCFNYGIAEVAKDKINVTVYSDENSVIDNFSIDKKRRIQSTKNVDSVISVFMPPLKDYFNTETIHWEVYVRNFLTNLVEGNVTVEAPENLIIEPGRLQTFFVRRDEDIRTLYYRAQLKKQKPGLYPLKVSVNLPGITNSMNCVIEKFPQKPVIAAWNFSSPEMSLDCTNSSFDILDGKIEANSISNILPEFFGSIDYIEAVDSKDISSYKIRLSGTNGHTTCKITWLCVNDEGHTNHVSDYNSIPINNQWYSRFFDLGREFHWVGKPAGVKIRPVSNPNVKIELDEVKLIRNKQ